MATPEMTSAAREHTTSILEHHQKRLLRRARGMDILKGLIDEAIEREELDKEQETILWEIFVSMRA